MSEFHRTNMGHKFYEGTMPALVQQLIRLNENLEKLLKHIDEVNEFEVRIATQEGENER